MKIDESGLEMRIKDWFGGKKSKQIVNTQENPVNSEPEIQDPTRRKLMKGMGATMTATSLGIGSILTHFDTQAYSLRDELRSKYNNSNVQNGAKPELCQDSIIREAFVYLVNEGHNLNAIKSVLYGLDRNSQSIHIMQDSVYCEPLAYVAANTYRWKSGDNIDFPRGQIQTLEREFYHNFALKKGIDAFYDWHVIKKKKGANPEIEQWLVHNIFTCAEEYLPQIQAAINNGTIRSEQLINEEQRRKDQAIAKAQTYFSSNLQKRAEMIAELKANFTEISWTTLDKRQRNISDKSKQLGPHNNWYRLLSAQGGSFLLTCHYRSLQQLNINSAKENGDLVNKNIEKEIRKKMPKVRGPPNYPGF